MSRLAAHIQESPVLLDDPVHGWQSESGPLADFFRGKEGFEYTVEGCCVHAGTCIRHAKLDISTRTAVGMHAYEVLGHLDVSGLQYDLASLWHRVAGVPDQIHDHL